MTTQNKFDTLTLSIPAHWLVPLMYGDTTGLDDAEDAAFGRWLTDTMRELGAFHVGDISPDTHFARYHDAAEYGVLACDCHDVTLWRHDRRSHRHPVPVCHPLAGTVHRPWAGVLKERDMTDNERPLYRYPVHAADTHGMLHYIWTLPDVNVDAYLAFRKAADNQPIVVFVRSNETGDWKWSTLTSLIDVRNWFGTGSDMTRAMTYHKAKDMIAAMNKYSKVEEACLEYFGERCPDFEPGCPTCEGWRQFDRLCDAHNKRRGT